MPLHVMPAKREAREVASSQKINTAEFMSDWIPAYAGMTVNKRRSIIS